MFNKFRNTLHEKVHGAKISRQKRYVKPESSGVDECETSSASSAEPDQLDPDRFRISTTFAVELTVQSVVDLAASPAYFYACIGEEGEPTALKKKRGIQSSGILYGKCPQLPHTSFLLPINGLTSPELTIRFSRSSIVGTDTFLGECNLKINLKGSLDSLGDNLVMRIAGGGLAVACISWKLLPFDAKSPLEKRSNILPEVHYTNENDKLDGLVQSIRKTLNSVSSIDEEISSVDSPLRYKLDFLTSVFNSISAIELDYVLCRISVYDLVKFVPSLFELNNAAFMVNLKSSVTSALNLARVIRALESSTTSEVISKLIISCVDTQRLDEVKYILNRGGDKYDLVYLINNVIESKFLRDQILVHFENFATTNLGIVSEIDQVVYSPFGSVRMWPDGPIPGFKLLFDALSYDVTFVSNRPISSMVDTRKIVREVGMSDAPLLVSSLGNPTPPSHGGGLVQRLQQSYSESVIEGWNQYKRVFAKRNVVWFGENIDMAKQLMRVQAGSSRVTKIVLAIVMGDDMVGKGGPVLVDDDSGRIVACANYVQAAMACLDYGYLSLDTIERFGLISNFQKTIEKLIKSLDSDKVRHKYLIKERINDMRFDLQRLAAKVQTLLRKSGYGQANAASPVITAEDLVDSVILTPIEALSPTLTNHSPSPGPTVITTGSYDSEIILTGV